MDFRGLQSRSLNRLRWGVCIGEGVEDSGENCIMQLMFNLIFLVASYYPKVQVRGETILISGRTL